MATPNIVPRAAGEGGLGTAAKGWGGTFVTNTTTSSSTQGGKLVLAADDGAVMASGHRLGVVEFSGAEDTSSTLTIGARIEALADATWSASENGASLKFYTTDGNASQSEVLKLDSNGKTTCTQTRTTAAGNTQAFVVAAAYTGDAAQDSTGMHLDFDRGVPSSGTAAHNDIGLNLDVTSASLGTSSLKGIEMDVVGTSSGTSTAYGIDLDVDGADTNIGIQINTAGTHMKLVANADADDYATMAVADTGDLTIATVGDGSLDSDLTLDVDGDIEINADGGDIALKDGALTLAHVDNIGSATVTGGQIAVVGRKLAITSTTVGDFDGDVVYFGTGSTVLGEIVHFKSDGTWEAVNANAVATSDGLLGVALGTDPDVHGVLLRGMATIGDIDGTEAVGDVLFLSEDATGHANCVAPAGSGDIVRVIGYALHATNKTIWFNPDNTFIELS